jgi:thioredoxin reductase
MAHDAIIVGGSFAGLSAAMQLGRANRTAVVLDTGTPRNRFAEASHGFFGQDGAAPRDMIATARAKVAAYRSVSFVDREAVAAGPAGGGFTVTLADGTRLEAPALVLAFGLADTLPDIPGLRERWGRTVLHCPYCHGIEFLGRPLGVLSTTPMSVHQAQLIPEWGPTTFFLNGGPMPDAEMAGRLAARGVAIEATPVTGVDGDARVTLADGRRIDLAALYLAPLSTPRSPIADQLGCAMEEGPLGTIVRTDGMKATSVPGVYAAGDITRFAHNATFASADGVQAGASVHRQLVFGLG